MRAATSWLVSPITTTPARTERFHRNAPSRHTRAPRRRSSTFARRSSARRRRRSARARYMAEMYGGRAHRTPQVVLDPDRASVAPWHS